MPGFIGLLKVFLPTPPADLRKGFFGVQAMTARVLREDPQSGALFVLNNRDRLRIKSLYRDGTGLWIMTKRLKKGRFSNLGSLDALKKGGLPVESGAAPAEK